MSGGGGGSSSSNYTTDAIVQYTDPWAAMDAGYINSIAAQSANAAAQGMYENAINEVNSQYNKAVETLQPTTEESVQALDQMNYLMGMQPYNPGAAPVEPTAPTSQQLAQQAQQYVMGDSYYDFLNPSGSTSSGSGGQTGSNGNTTTGLTLALNGNTGGQMFLYSGPGAIQTDQSGIPYGPGITTGTPPQLGVPGANNYSVNPNYGPEYMNPLAVATIGTQGMGPGQYVQPTDSSLQAQESALEQNPAWGQLYSSLIQSNDLPAIQNYQNEMQSYNDQMNVWSLADQLNQKYTAEGPISGAQLNNYVSNLPGYQAQMNQGTAAINAQAASQGLLGSGAQLKSLNAFGQNTLATFYGNELSQLAGLAGLGYQGEAATANAQTGQGNTVAGINAQQGTSAANSQLASGNALSQALIAANQQFATLQTGSGSSSSQQNGSYDLSGVGSLIGSFL